MVKVESGVVPVVDDGKVVGLITDRDIVIRVVAEGLGMDTPVAQVMTERSRPAGRTTMSPTRPPRWARNRSAGSRC